MSLEGDAYVLGHSELELARLRQQARIFEAATADLLRRAGIEQGMRVLDIGCGVGDVSMIAAGIVGPRGVVVGLDRSERALSVARRRVEPSGYGRLEFVGGELDSARFDEPFDALIGRFILLHLRDREATLRRLRPLVKSGGIMAFIEMDIGTTSIVPDMPLFRKCVGWITDLYARTGTEIDMGAKLYATLRAIGLEPEMHGICRIEAGPEAGAYDYLAETLRSLVPNLEAAGVATAGEIAVDTLASRLRTAAVAGGHCIFFPRLVGAWARTSPQPGRRRIGES